MPRLEHVNVPNDGRYPILEVPLDFEVSGEECAVPEGRDDTPPAEQVRIANGVALIGLLGIKGNELNVHVTKLHVRVVVPYVLDELRAVAALRPGRGGNHAVIDPLIVPERIRV